MKIEQINNLDNEVYHNSDKYSEFWSSSNLKNYLETPKEAYYQKYVAPAKSSDALMFGNQIHDYLASKHMNGQPFNYNQFEPPINPKTSKPYGKGTKAYDAELSMIDNPISADTMQLIDDIWREFKKFNDFWWVHKNVLKKGIAEASFFVDGIHKYKYRPDILTDKYIIDWKTASKNIWSEKGLKYRVTDFGYDISAAFYQYFEYQRTGIWKPFIIIWIMKDPPFDFLIDDISKFAYENIGGGDVLPNNGAVTFQKLKDQHELCEMAKKWPGISGQYQISRGIRSADYQLSSFQERYYEQFSIDENKF